MLSLLKITVKIAFFSFFICGRLLAENYFCAGASSRLDFSASSKFVGEAQVSYRKVFSVAGDFLQFSDYGALDFSEVSRGKVWFVKPDLARFSYAEPEPQEYLMRSAKIYHYSPIDRQLSVRDIKDLFLPEAPVAFLIGVGELEKSLRLMGCCQLDDKRLERYQLKPLSTLLCEFKPREKPSKKGDEAERASSSRLAILFSVADKIPLGVESLDESGNKITIVLDIKERNKEVSPAVFAMDIPDSTDFIKYD
ncbi:MAG TPA: outer membrane lipoprotein carrier protein LolA [Oligoflexia bacterium]|nr:outer membrane lipoprotein carrier protein LolA [Oligoflexia bacterium]HMP27780.1 outer membrane lipoprotein carrier protein LolA [Oligoflexia bacterium]